MITKTLVLAFLLLAGAMLSLAQSSESVPGFMTIQTSMPVSVSLPPVESQMSILPITTDVSIGLPQATTPEMSIPAGETPLSTGELPITTSTLTGTGGGSAAPSSTPNGTSSAPPENTTNAAPPLVVADGTPFLFALALSGLSITLGSAWTLL